MSSQVANILPTESPSTPTSYVSLLDSSQSSSETPALSVDQCSTYKWIRTFGTVRQWSTRTFKFTRQLFQEQMGHCTKTQDFELEQNIELFRENKQHYEQLLKEARQMLIHFAGLLQTQRSLSQSFADLLRISTKSEQLTEQFSRNGECQQILAQNGDNLLNSINTFVNSLQTLVTKTMEDTSMTIKAYEKARIEYDAYRNDYERVLARNHTGGVKLNHSEENIERQYLHFKQLYEKFKADTNVKLRLLDDNQIKVMQQQLFVFHNSIVAYFSMTQKQLNLF